ncbi:BTAD domain-containing putative transcriptional regulator [Streptomyces oceani]|uniref:OmpR/PhoB-type domain-containing protein n=1 Tax=Streptomyces oceani TaxID=1075402 RepID=A0A1E7KIX7_9ACTN|nr:BTAD domain-containing putative transcriptional regulator [Streptomyces oceani]OEV03890.1 hypothetical protein AN216_09600 [Streptomyces oceani]
MHIGVLGPLRVVVDGRNVPVGGVRLRALLVTLALNAGETVTSRALIDALWPDDMPDHPNSALHSLISRLRRTLRPYDVLGSEPAGYRLRLPADAVDAVRFERLTTEGRRALRDGARGLAADRLSEALRLWRGEPLAEVAELACGTAASVRLRERWLDATEDLFEAQLDDAGVDRSATIAELERLIAAHPLRERLRLLLLTALEADGRQVEALAAYQDYRTVAAEELGVEPGAELRGLHLRILRDGAGSESTRSARSNLRAPLTSYVGRESEQRHLRERFGASRLVTLVGPGGVGKTRLATTFAADLPDAVCLVELAPVHSPEDVPHAVASALGLRSPGDVLSRVAETLSARDTLLVLDGCEHLAEAVARLAEELLGRCPALRVLATGRESLGITAEALCPVPPLEPGPAVQLFVDRARAVRPDFARTEAVARICERLDGLPLAIELAAARLRSMPIETLTEALDDRFRLLSGGSRTAPPRHRTLRSVVAWSWELLSESERVAAELTAVFQSGCTVDSAERVGVTREALYALVDKSLVIVDGCRYRMLDTILEYGRERLSETGRLHSARVAHAACFLELAERAEPELRGAGQLPWIARLTAEHDNLLAALRFAGDTGDADTAVRLGAALGMFWTVRGEHAGSVRHLATVWGLAEGAAERDRLRATAGYLLNAVFAGELADVRTVVGPPPHTHDPTAAFVRALLALGTEEAEVGLSALEPHLGHPDAWTRGMLWFACSLLHGAAGATREGRRSIAQAVTAFREAGERWALSIALMSLASARITAGDAAEACRMLTEAERLAEDLGAHDGQRVWLAMVRVHAGDITVAHAELREVVRQAHSTHQVALARVVLADLARQDDDLAEAERQLALADRGSLIDTPERLLYLGCAGHLATATGELDVAARHLDTARHLAATMPDMPMLAHLAVALADLRHRQGDAYAAAELLGAAHALRGGPNPHHPDVARLLGELHAHTAAYERGRALKPGRALARVQLG